MIKLILSSTYDQEEIKADALKYLHLFQEGWHWLNINGKKLTLFLVLSFFGGLQVYCIFGLILKALFPSIQLPIFSD
jgi:hypothetical protein